MYAIRSYYGQHFALVISQRGQFQIIAQAPLVFDGETVLRGLSQAVGVELVQGLANGVELVAEGVNGVL